MNNTLHHNATPQNKPNHQNNKQTKGGETENKNLNRSYIHDASMNRLG